MTAYVDPVECVGCEACVSVCPAGAIAMEDEVAVIEAEKCNNFEVCINECPVEAITMK